MDIDQLRTLAAVVDAGTFEQAARTLGVTPPAVSQRIKALERQVGRVLVERTVPAQPTGPGEKMLRFARQVLELHQATMTTLGAHRGDRAELTVAVNADSLATWFTQVVEAAAEWDDVVLRIQVEDQDHSRDLLRSGEVQAAVTTSSHPVAGCRSIPLGTMEYRPVIAPKLQARFALGDRVDLAQCPVVVYDHKDDFQHNQLQGRSLTAEPPVHAVPSSEGYVRAVASGLGWGMVPSLQLTKERIARECELIDVRELDTVRVPLYLQRWSIALPGLDRLEYAVRLAAASLGTDQVHIGHDVPDRGQNS